MLLSRYKKAIWWAWGKTNSWRFNSFGRRIFISPSACIQFKERVSLGDNCRIGPYTVLEATSLDSTITIDSNCFIQQGTILTTYGGYFAIGSYCSLQPYVIMIGPGNIEVGNNVRIAPGVKIIAGNHVFDRRDIPIYKQGMKSLGITIEDDCWIGTNAVILDGVILRKGSIIGAGAVVTKSTNPYGIYTGVPAKLYKERI